MDLNVVYLSQVGNAFKLVAGGSVVVAPAAYFERYTFIQDMFFLHERARKINIWSGFIVVLTYLGPLLAAFIINMQIWQSAASMPKLSLARICRRPSLASKSVIVAPNVIFAPLPLLFPQLSLLRPFPLQFLTISALAVVFYALYLI